MPLLPTALYRALQIPEGTDETATLHQVKALNVSLKSAPARGARC